RLNALGMAVAGEEDDDRIVEVQQSFGPRDPDRQRRDGLGSRVQVDEVVGPKPVLDRLVALAAEVDPVDTQVLFDVAQPEAVQQGGAGGGHRRPLRQAWGRCSLYEHYPREHGTRGSTC